MIRISKRKAWKWTARIKRRCCCGRSRRSEGRGNRLRMSKHEKACREFVSRYLGREWKASDGLSEKVVKKAETRLGIKLPSALRGFYLSVGALPDLCSIQNFILHPKNLSIE